MKLKKSNLEIKYQRICCICDLCNDDQLAGAISVDIDYEVWRNFEPELELINFITDVRIETSVHLQNFSN